MIITIRALVVGGLLLGGYVYAEHEGGSGYQRREFSRSCKLYATGDVKYFPNFGVAAFARNANRVLTTSVQGVTGLVDVASGSRTTTKEDGGVRFAELSNNGELLLTSVTGKGATLRDASGKILHTFATSAQVNLARFTPDGKMLVIAAVDGSYQLFDTTSGKKITDGKHGRALTSLEVAPDGKAFLTGSTDGTAHLVGTEIGGQKKIIEHADGVNSVVFSPDGKYAATASRDKTVKVIELSSQREVLTVKHGDWAKSVAFGAGTLITGSTDGAARVYDLNAGSELFRIKHNEEVNSVAVSADGRYVVTGSKDGTSKVYHVGNKAQISSVKHDGWVTSVALSADGQSLATGSRDGTARLTDVLSGREISKVSHGKFVSKVAFTPDGSKFLSASGAKVVVSDVKPECVEENLTYLPARSAATAGTTLHRRIEEELCPNEFNEEDWKFFTPPNPGDKIPHITAKAYLYRFQKPKGFDPSQHLRILLAILNSSLIEKEPVLVTGALQTVALVSPQLYDELINRIPALKLLPKNVEPGICRTADEKKKIAEASQHLFEHVQRKHSGGGTSLADWAPLYPFRSEFAKLSEKRRDDLAGEVAESLANGAQQDPKLQGIFQSKLYYFSYEAAKPLFGLKQTDHKTDVTIIREPDKAKVVLIGVHPVDGDVGTLTPYGFYAKTVGQLDLSGELTPGEVDISKLGMKPDVAWTHQGRAYKANVSALALKSLADVIPKGNAYPYDELWKDGKLSGVIITGTNLKESAASVMDSYLNYYTDQGFEFGSKTDIDNLPRFLEGQIKSGDTDYMLKEAHSDGDEKNIFRMDQTGSMLVGKKKLEGGKEEEIRLIFPKDGEVKTKLVSNHDFGDWIRAREAAGKGSLVYFNTSCWSCSKAVHEIEAAHSLKLVDISTTNMASVFTKSEDNPLRIILDTFRGGKNYEEVRDALRKRDDYKAGSGNTYIFPDEPLYREKITDILKKPVVFNTKILDQDGNPYNLDQVGH